MHSSVPQSEWQVTRTPPAPSGGGRQDEKENEHETSSPVPQFSGPITRTMARHGAEGVDRTKKKEGTIPNPAQNSENTSWATIERLEYSDQPRH